jgi:hypothetical protein
MRRPKSDALKAFRVNGELCEINVNSDGIFYGRIGPDSFEADTMAEVERNMRRVAKKLKREVAIPAMLIAAEVKYDGPHSHMRGNVVGRTCLPITIIGVDWRTNDLKYRGPDGQIMQRRRYGQESQFGKRMTPEQVEQWAALRKAKREAETAFSDFEREFEYRDIEKVVEQAIRDLSDDPKEQPVTETEDPR